MSRETWEALMERRPAAGQAGKRGKDSWSDDWQEGGPDAHPRQPADEHRSPQPLEDGRDSGGAAAPTLPRWGPQPWGRPRKAGQTGSRPDGLFPSLDALLKWAGEPCPSLARFKTGNQSRHQSRIQSRHQTSVSDRGRRYRTRAWRTPVGTAVRGLA